MAEQDGKHLEERVPESANRNRETRSEWWWVEPSVWTNRMLTALKTGVKGGKWYSLMDKVCSRSNLEAGLRKVVSHAGSAGIDQQSIDGFMKRRDENLAKLERELREGTYRPQAVKRVWIDKPGKPGEKRPLGIPTVRDRVVQSALKNVLEPIFENLFWQWSVGFRPGKGCKDALREVNRLLGLGYTWVVDADIKSYFDSISWEKLMSRIEDVIADGKVLTLVSNYLSQEIMDGMKGWTPEEGTPQGAVISPLLANIYLDPLDKHLAGRGYAIVRYADDFVVLCRSEGEARKALEEIQSWMDEAKLTLHPEKTRVVDASQPGGFDFLGYHFERGMKWPRTSSLRKFKDKIRKYTKRHNGLRMKSIIEKLNGILRGWFGYFKHSKKNTFSDLDGWIRMRLRSILRRRQKRKGRGRGKDHQCWPNAYFGKLGLFSLKAAHARACQSVQRQH